MGRSRAWIAPFATVWVALSLGPGCMTLADPVSTGGTGAILATGGTSASGGGNQGGSGATGGSSATGGSGATGGTGAQSGSENCQNGVDDDEDGAIDCADSNCKPGYTCVAVPAGGTVRRVTTQAWSGSLPSPAKCDDGNTAVRYFEGPGSAGCTPCTCGALTGATCGNTPIACAFGSTTCNGSATFNVSTCSNFQAPSGGMLSCALGSTPVIGGSCPPSTSKLSSPDPWTAVADACPLEAGGCDAGQACVPTADVSGPALCVAIPGTASCPAAWPSAETAYTSGSDSRACSACTCTTGNLICSSDSFNLMLAPDCVDFGPFPKFTSTSCKGYTLSGQTTWSIQRQPASKTPAGTCSASGGVPSGSVQVGGTTTLCCR